jgi:hypothetical protein
MCQRARGVLVTTDPAGEALGGALGFLLGLVACLERAGHRGQRLGALQQIRLEPHQHALAGREQTRRVERRPRIGRSDLPRRVIPPERGGTLTKNTASRLCHTEPVLEAHAPGIALAARHRPKEHYNVAHFRVRCTCMFVWMHGRFATGDNDADSVHRGTQSLIEELRAYLRTAHDSPLDRLAPAARQNFLDSLVFGEHELGGFRYEDLQALPADDVYRILHLFGAERTVPMVLHANPHAQAPRLPREPGRDDHENYYCQSPHNCNTNPGWICMTGC